MCGENLAFLKLHLMTARHGNVAVRMCLNADGFRMNQNFRHDKLAIQIILRPTLRSRFQLVPSINVTRLTTKLSRRFSTQMRKVSEEALYFESTVGQSQS